MVSSATLMIALRHRVQFVEGATAAESRFVFATPQGPLEATAQEALGPLSTGIRALNADASVRAWATPAIHALRLMASGALADPTAPDFGRLIEAGKNLDPDPATGARLARAFISALLEDAPAVATTPQKLAGTERLKTRNRVTIPSFTYRFVIEFLPTDNDAPEPGSPVATGSLRFVPESRGWSDSPAAELWTNPDHPFGDQGRDRIMRMLERLEATWPAARLLIASPGRDSIDLNAEDLNALLSPRLTVSLLANRVTVAWPAQTSQSLTAVAVINERTSTPVTGVRTSGPTRFISDGGFRVSWKFSVGGHNLDAAELEQLVTSASGLIRLRDQWVLIDRAMARHALDTPERHLTAYEALRASLVGELDIDGRKTPVDTHGWLDDIRQRLAARGESLQPTTAPPGLGGTLRDYQLQGLAWMSSLHSLGLGGILADDMGLGKTFMLIALHVQLHEAAGENRPTLVVCPASVMTTWEREIAKFAPGQHVTRFHGTGRSLAGINEGFIITTYATMRASIHELAEVEWALVVADEAQHVKNHRSAAAKALRRLHGDMRMALTGTPVENNLAELWSILDWTTPGLLGTREQFRGTWATPIERHRDDDTAKELSTLIRPFVLRRRKSDPGIAPELPEKIETDHLVSLTKEQLGLYESVSRAAMAEIELSAGIKRRGLVVRLITQLKQICNHPAQFLKEPVTASSGPTLAGRSAKLQVLDELIEEIQAEGGAALVFTQYTQMATLLTQHFNAMDVKYLYLHGGTPVPTREKMVEEFQRGNVPVFVLSLKAAGTGLNLTRADHVIHFDRWWNPAVEDQATDRAHRIGQTKTVQVHRLINEGTIEESVAELIAAKRSLADAVVNSGEIALTELTNAELAQLIALRR